jgi:hypothetical protein
MPSQQQFFQEVKEQFQRQLDIKDSLEGKANNLLTISGTVGTLLFGFGTFLIEKIAPQYPFILIITTFLVAGIIAIVVALLYAVYAFRLQAYLFPIHHRIFFPNNQLSNAIIGQFEAADVAEFYVTMINAYLNGIKMNSEKNDEKASRLKLSQYFFIAGVLTIPIIAGIILIAQPPIR